MPNLVVVKLGTGGKVSLYNGTGGTVDLIADVAGYYLAGTPTEAGAFTALSPARILDTRYGTGAARAKVAKHATVHLQVTGKGGVPASGVSAVVLNVTATNPASSGYITAYPDGTSRPTASNLNLVKGQTVPNLVVVKLGAGGRVSLYNGTGGTVDLIADVAGYYLADTTPPDTTPPGPVTALSATPGETSVELSWTNPADSDLAGVMIRRATGATPPAIPTAGTEVTDTTGSTATFTDTGLTAGTTYSYALFAHDAVPNYATGAVTTTTTQTASGGTIHGTVTDAAGSHAPLAGVVVHATSSSAHVGLTSSIEATTGADGTYDLPGLPAANDYSVCFDGSQATGGSTDGFGYAYACHDASPYAGTVVVTDGDTTTVDEQMSAGGAITGTVRDAGGSNHALAGVTISVTNYTLSDVRIEATAATGTDGTYSVRGLPVGSNYAVCFTGNEATGGSSDTTGYVAECWDNQPGPATSTSVTVAAATATTGIDGSLGAGGRITGTVTQSGGGGSPLAGVTVDLQQNTDFGSSGRVETAADGTYSFEGLQPGTDYQVCFSGDDATGGSSDATGYVGQCWRGQPVGGTPTPVTVTAGSTTADISAALVAGGSISGSVTQSGTGASLAGVAIRVSDYSLNLPYEPSAQTATDGTYSIRALPASTHYMVCFDASLATGGSNDTTGYSGQCWHNQPSTGTPTSVTVTSGVTTSGIDASLALAGAISGTVTQAGTGAPLADVGLSVSSDSVSDYGYGYTRPDGTYTVAGLDPATDYTVCFDSSGATGGSSDATGYVGQCWHNQPSTGTPTPVTVTSGGTTSGIDASLAVAGAISGTVTESGTGAPLAGVFVDYYGSASTGGEGYTNADGTYTVTGLDPATDYTVCFDASWATGGSSDASGYVGQCWHNQPLTGTPTSVTVTSGVTTSGIDASLVPGGAISGTVTEAGAGPALAGVWVSVWSGSTSASEYGYTDADGTYTVTGLDAATDYTVCFDATGATGGSSDASGYVGQCWHNQPLTGTPTSVTVTSGVTTSGIDASLALAGAISGTVTESGTGALLGDVEVDVSSSSTATSAFGYTDADGTYTLAGLDPATDYVVCFRGDFATGGSSASYTYQCYNNKPDETTADPVTVTSGATKANIDAALSPS